MIQSASTSSELAERLRERIRREGPITFRDWMEAALYDPLDGYYRGQHQPWGREGDYRTSSERSTLFAATFARYFANLHRLLNRPPAWTIVEVGAGNGRFARVVLETLRARFPEVFAATRYVIDETGADSRAPIAEELKDLRDRVQFRTLADLDPVNPGIIFSNELLDAFPVHRVTVRQGELCELYVTVTARDTFDWIAGPLSTDALGNYFAASGIELQEEQFAEVNLRIGDWLKMVADSLLNGYLVSVDYGAEAADLFSPTVRPTGTLRAFHRHQQVADVLARPGEQDLTTTIDWTFVKRSGQTLGLQTLEFERQDKFLLAAGLLDELELQSDAATSEAERLSLRTSAREMILPNSMAASFQVLVQRKGP